MFIERRLNTSTNAVGLWQCEWEYPEGAPAKKVFVTKAGEEQALAVPDQNSLAEVQAICWAYGRTLGNIAVTSQSVIGSFDANHGSDAVLPCDFVGAGKFRNGPARWWCRTHQTYWGTKADHASLAQSGVMRCANHSQPMNYVLSPFVLNVITAIPVDGSPRTTTLQALGKPLNGFVDSFGAHFVVLDDLDTFHYRLVGWDGLSEPVIELEIPSGATDLDSLQQLDCASAGSTTDGGLWIVRTILDDGVPRVVLFVRSADTEVELPLNAVGTVAFMATAAVSAAGRLHLAWYETTGPTGVLKYTRSVSGNLAEGISPASVIDANAIPGDGWVPLDEPRRLREYIDLTVVGERAYVAWTRAAIPPSRVYAIWVEPTD
jgi:hypothetical protein